MKYTVHIYLIVRVKVAGIEADSQEEAMKKAEAKVDFHTIFDSMNETIEYAEDIDGFHVDEEDDPEYTRSRWYDKHYQPL